MTTQNLAPLIDECCPVAMGEVCWNDGVESGQAFAIYNPVTETTTFIDKLTGSIVAGADIVACPPENTDIVDAIEDSNALLTSIDAKTIVAAPITTTNAPVTRVTATAAGNTAAGLGSATFINVGTAPGTVAGAALNPGEAITFNAYFDNFTRIFHRVPAIAYVASATAILRISTQN